MLKAQKIYSNRTAFSVLSTSAFLLEHNSEVCGVVTVYLLHSYTPALWKLTITTLNKINGKKKHV